MGRLRKKKRRGLLTSQEGRTKLTDSNGCNNFASPMAVFNTARVRLFATHLHNPLVVYKAFQFLIILAKILILFLPRPLGYGCNDFGCLYSSHIHVVHEHACSHTCAHPCIVAHMDTYIFPAHCINWQRIELYSPQHA